jgi:hypothetical protein
VAVLVRFDVAPRNGQVGLVDAAWDDYPWLDGDDSWVEVQGDTAAEDAGPPYPGVSVATVPEAGSVAVEVRRDERPAGLRLVHTTAVTVGDDGAAAGPPLAMEPVPVPPGEYDLEIWVDAGAPREVRHVCFVLAGRRPRTLARLRVEPPEGRVVLQDASWDDDPEPAADAWVGLRAERPPYTGIAVATAPGAPADPAGSAAEGDAGPAAGGVLVEVVRDGPAAGLHLVHAAELVLRDRGTAVGCEGAWAHPALPGGLYDLEVWVDAETPAAVRHVCFVVAEVPPEPPAEEPEHRGHRPAGARGIPPEIVLALGILVALLALGGLYLRSRGESVSTAQAVAGLLGLGLLAGAVRGVRRR